MASKTWKKVAVFLGSTREGRQGDRVAKFVLNSLKKKNLEVVYVDPLEFELPLLEKPLHFHRSPSQPPSKLVEMNNQLKAVDAFIVISAEYNHSIPPALSNVLDHFPPSSFAAKPSAILTYSPSIVGGARAGIQLRSLLGELGCISVSRMGAIPKVGSALLEDGTPSETEEGKHMSSMLEKLLDQLEWWASAAKNHRESAGGW